MLLTLYLKWPLELVQGEQEKKKKSTITDLNTLHDSNSFMKLKKFFVNEKFSNMLRFYKMRAIPKTLLVLDEKNILRLHNELETLFSFIYNCYQINFSAF